MNETLKEVSKIAGSLLAGIGCVYLLNRTGTIDVMVNALDTAYQFTHSWFNGNEGYTRSAIETKILEYSLDGAAGSLTAIIGYLGLNYKKFGDKE